MTDRKNITLIINPNSGTLSKRKLGQWLPGRIERLGYQVDMIHTKCKGDATEIARNCAERGCYGVLVCGGDGTVAEAATGLIGSSTALGILPAGSGNGLARHLGIPVDIDLSLGIIAQNNIQLCDYGTVNGRPFFCTYGLGFDAAVSKRFAKKQRRGFNSYIQSALDEFLKYKSAKYEIIADGHTISERAFLVAVCNASQYGNNAFIAPAASVSDGLLDIIIVHEGNVIDKAWMGVEMLAGAIGNHGHIRALKAKSLSIRCNESTDAHIDGEPTMFNGFANIECVHAGLKIFVPKHEIRIIPVLTPIWYTMREWGVVISRPFRRH